MSQSALEGVDATRHTLLGQSPVQETLAAETPIALVYNGHAHAVMMATPADLDDFAYGFSLTEGIVDRAADIEIVDRIAADAGVSLQMLIPRPQFLDLGERQRNLTGRTGCGLCGASTLDAAIRPVRSVSAAHDLDIALVLDAFVRLKAAQPYNDRCGALHAAGLLTPGGVLLVREDVGRHNAVDKVFGAAARQRLAPAALLVTSRASYEVVHKAAQMNCPLVAVISAPTALAVRIAQAAGITLIGFARDERVTVYAGRL